MVKKLFKHEFIAWLRIMAVVYAAVLSLSVALRFLVAVESNSVAYEVISGISIALYVFALMACVFYCPIFGVSRFYKNLFTGEGYLTHTLPVTANAHIWVKALTTGAMTFLSLLVVALSVVVLSAGELLTEIIKALEYLVGKIPAEYTGHIWIFALELLALTAVTCVFGPMLYFACVCVGQLFRKNRVAAAVGVYFAYNYISQFIFSVVLGLLAQSGTELPENMLEQMPTTLEIINAYHSLLWVGIVWTVFLGLIYYFVCHYVISKKLNLE